MFQRCKQRGGKSSFSFDFQARVVWSAEHCSAGKLIQKRAEQCSALRLISNYSAAFLKLCSESRANLLN
jgi:hypothetical protein